MSPQKLHCYDEAGSTLSMTRSHARAFKGERAVCSREASDRENITMAGLLGPTEIKVLYPYAGYFNGERYLDYVENHLIPSLQAGDAVIMDNARIHHIPQAKQKFLDAKIDLIFLPPYSPEYNPIEEGWSVIKSVLKKLEARSIPEYIDALDEAKMTLTPDKIKGFYQHAGYTLYD